MQLTRDTVKVDDVKNDLPVSYKWEVSIAATVERREGGNLGQVMSAGTVCRVNSRRATNRRSCRAKRWRIDCELARRRSKSLRRAC